MGCVHDTNQHRIARVLARASVRRRGFTLIEVTVVSVVIIIIAALTLVAAGPIVKSVRSEAERQLLRSLVVATESFRQRFGALPPLVDESQTLVSVSFQSINNTQLFAVRVPFSGAGGTTPLEADWQARTNAFLAFFDQAGRSRSSVLSPTIFLLGVLPSQFDGADGPRMTACDPTTGMFNRGGPTIEPLFDSSSVKERLVPSNFNVIGEALPVKQLVDRWGNPIRYYRWLPTRHIASIVGQTNVYRGWNKSGAFDAPAVGNNVDTPGEIRSYNVPVLLGNPYEVGAAALRSAGFAFLSAGPDGEFDESLPPDQGVNKDNIVELGQ